MYFNSTFFFSPGGDTGPRKALFDGLLANSIPVIFEEVSFDVTYPAYFPGNPRDYTIFLETTEDIMGQLWEIPSWRVAELQRNISRVRNSISYLPDEAFDATWIIMQELKQYALNGYKFTDRFRNKTTLECVKNGTHRIGGKCRFS